MGLAGPETTLDDSCHGAGRRSVRHMRLCPSTSLSNRATLRFATLATLVASFPVAAAEAGDEFTNNLLTDIAPLLSLFGERVAQQFLATSMGVVDNIIFAIAPLGIITAIVSAIRCSGSAGLKSLVGRSREGRGTVEAELLSSTSDDVVELWNGSGIVRVLGKAQIMQIVYVTPSTAAPAGPQNSGQPDDQNSGIELAAQAGGGGQKLNIYDFNRAVSQKLLVNQRRKDTNRSLWGWLRYPDPTWEYQRLDIGAIPTDDATRDHSTPNVTLNVSALQASGAESWVVVIVGTLLQLAVIVFAGISVFMEKWGKYFQKNGETVNSYAFWVFAPGLVTLLLGMLLCAYIVDKNTIEEKWDIKEPKGQKLSFAWLQKGGTVGDQVFDSYIIQPYDVGGHTGASRWRVLPKFLRRRLEQPTRAPAVITSRRSATAGQNLQFLTALATATSLVGYVLYFFGLRFLHFSVTLCQLALTAFMVILRAWVRRYMTHTPRHQRVPEKFELESMAKLTHGCKLWNVVSKTFDDGKDRSKHQAAAEILEARRRLGELSAWPGVCDDVASQVTDALELTANFIFSSPDNGFVIRDGWSSQSHFEWKLLVEVGLEPGDNKDGVTRLEEITLRLSRRRLEGGGWGRWVSQTDIKGILGLWIMNFETPSRVTFTPTREHQTLRIYGYSRIATRYIFEKWIRRPQPVVELLERHSVSRKSPARFTVGLPVALDHGTENWVGVLSNSPVRQTCGQLIFNEFLPTLVNDVIKTTKFEIQDDDASFSVSELGKLVDGLTQTGLFNSEEAYLALVNTLAEAQKLVIADTTHINPISVSSTLPKVGGPESGTSPAPDEAGLSASSLWFSHLGETLCNFYELQEEWDEAASVYRRLLDPPCRDSSLLRQRFDLFEQRSKVQSDPVAVSDASGQRSYQTTSEYQEGQHQSLVPETSEGKHLRMIGARNRELLKAAATGDLLTVCRLIRNLDSIEIDTTDDHGCTALIRASQSGHAVIAGVLLKGGASANHQDSEHRAALHYAAMKDFESVAITLLLGRGTKYNLLDKDGRTPWDLAAGSNNPRLISIFRFYCGTNNSLPRGTWSQLHWPGWMGVCSAEPLKFINWGGVEEPARKDAMKIAALNGGHDVLWGILFEIIRRESGAGQHSSSRDLNLSAMKGDAAQVFKLLNNGADLHASDTAGRTPLCSAASEGHTELVALFLDRGADLQAQASPGGTPLHLAASGGHMETAALLLDRGADLQARNSPGRTPLHSAAEGGHRETAALFLGRGADPQARDSFRRTPLHLTAFAGHTETAALLLDRGADLETRDTLHQTPLHEAAAGSRIKTVALLLDRGADPQVRNRYGVTPLRLVSQGVHIEMAALLHGRTVSP